MKISTKAATFLSSIKTQTYDKKESEMIITYQQKRVFHLSLLMLALCCCVVVFLSIYKFKILVFCFGGWFIGMYFAVEIQGV